FHDPAATDISTLSLHDALPILIRRCASLSHCTMMSPSLWVSQRPPKPDQSAPPSMGPAMTAPVRLSKTAMGAAVAAARMGPADLDRKSTRLNHVASSYAVFCLK